MIDTAHHEKHFEAYIVEKLKAQGWLVGTTAGYNIEHALYPEDLVAWLQDTQDDKWKKLVAANGTKATEVLMARLAQALEEKGTIHTLRRGFAIAGCGHIDLSEAEPEDKRNEKVKKRYARTGCVWSLSSSTTRPASSRSIWSSSSTAWRSPPSR
jgi:type I restriction enzyme R subunit